MKKHAMRKLLHERAVDRLRVKIELKQAKKKLDELREGRGELQRELSQQRQRAIRLENELELYKLLAEERSQHLTTMRRLRDHEERNRSLRHYNKMRRLRGELSRARGEAKRLRLQYEPLETAPLPPHERFGVEIVAAAPAELKTEDE